MAPTHIGIPSQIVSRYTKPGITEQRFVESSCSRPGKGVCPRVQLCGAARRTNACSQNRQPRHVARTAAPASSAADGEAAAAVAQQDAAATAPQSDSFVLQDQHRLAREKSEKGQPQSQPQSRPDTPTWPWVQGMFSSSGGSTGSSTAALTTTTAQPSLPLPPFWELPRGWELPRQLARFTNTQGPGIPSPVPADSAAPVGTAADAAASNGTARSPSPASQRSLARSLAAALRQMQPSSSRSGNSHGALSLSALLKSSSSSSSNGSSGSNATIAADDTVLAAARLLQQVRDAVSDSAWDGFVEGLQLQATDALQLTAVEASITASRAGETSDSSSSSSEGHARIESLIGQYQQQEDDAAAPAAGHMSMAGRHLVTHIPVMSSATALTMHQKHQQQLQEQQQCNLQDAGDTQSEHTKQQQQQQHKQDVVDKLNQLQEQLHEQLQAGYYHNPLASMRDDLPGHTAYNWDAWHSTTHHEQEQRTDSVAFTVSPNTQPSGAFNKSRSVSNARSSKSKTPYKQQQPAPQKLKSDLADSSATTTSSSSMAAEHSSIQRRVKFARPAVLVSYDNMNSMSSAWEGGVITTSSTAGTSSSGIGALAPFPKYEYLVFGGGGARCFGYAGALHALRQLGLLGHLKGVSGSSGGAVYALLAALRFSVPEVQAAMGTLPETETLSWLRLNSRLGLSDGEATFRQIEAAISAKLGVHHPSLADVAAAAGCSITLAATSLSRRAPVYLSSTTHPDMPVRDALRASCAIPFFFTPLRGPGGDLLVDGCISDCAPVEGLRAGLAAEGASWDPQQTLVMAVHDATGMDSPDFQGLLSSLISTVMQAGFHFTAAAGIDLLNLWPAVASVNPLQFRMSPEQARDIVAASQALAEEFAVKKMKQWEAAAAQPSSRSSMGQAPQASTRHSKDRPVRVATSLLAGMGSSGVPGGATAARVLASHHDALLAAGLHNSYAHASEQHALAAGAASMGAAAADWDGYDGSTGTEKPLHHIVTMEGTHSAVAGMRHRTGLESRDGGMHSSPRHRLGSTGAHGSKVAGRHANAMGQSTLDWCSSSSSSSSRGGGLSSVASHELSDEDWAEEDLIGFMGVDSEGEDDYEYDRPVAPHRLPSTQPHDSDNSSSSQGRDWGSSLLSAAGLGGLLSGSSSSSSSSVQDRWLGRLAVERLLRAAGLAPAAAAPAAAAQPAQAAGSDMAAAAPSTGREDPVALGPSGSVLARHMTAAEWQMLQQVLEQQEQLLAKQEQILLAAHQQQQAHQKAQQQQQQQQGAAGHVHEGQQQQSGAAACPAVAPVEFVVRELDGISQVFPVAAVTAHISLSGSSSSSDAAGEAGSTAKASSCCLAAPAESTAVQQQQQQEKGLSMSDAAWDCPRPITSTWDES